MESIRVFPAATTRQREMAEPLPLGGAQHVIIGETRKQESKKRGVVKSLQKVWLKRCGYQEAEPAGEKATTSDVWAHAPNRLCPFCLFRLYSVMSVPLCVLCAS